MSTPVTKPIEHQSAAADERLNHLSAMGLLPRPTRVASDTFGYIVLSSFITFTGAWLYIQISSESLPAWMQELNDHLNDDIGTGLLMAMFTGILLPISCVAIPVYMWRIAYVDRGLIGSENNSGNQLLDEHDLFAQHITRWTSGYKERGVLLETLRTGSYEGTLFQKFLVLLTVIVSKIGMETFTDKQGIVRDFETGRKVDPSWRDWEPDRDPNSAGARIARIARIFGAGL